MRSPIISAHHDGGLAGSVNTRRRGVGMRICDLTTLYIDGGAGGVNTYLHEKARFLADVGGAEHSIIVPAARSERRNLFGSTVHAVRSPRLPWDRQHRVLSDFRTVRRALCGARR